MIVVEEVVLHANWSWKVDGGNFSVGEQEASTYLFDVSKGNNGKSGVDVKEEGSDFLHSGEVD